MSEGMIERVAKAIRIADNCNGPAGEPCGKCDDPSYAGCRAIARVAIEAMRVPTAVMEDAGEIARDVDDCGVMYTYTAMIDAALGKLPT